VKVTDNHFGGNFSHLNPEISRFEIAIELSFQDRVVVMVIFEESQSKELILNIDLLRVFT
jgi:hypothetical protein